MLTKERRDEMRAANDSPIAMDGDDVGLSREQIGQLLDALDEMERERDAAWLAGAAAMREAAASEARRDGSVMLASCIDRIVLPPRP